MKAFIVCSILSLVAVATAEPPTNKYLPPGGGYNTPSGFGGGYSGGSGGSDEGPYEPANYEFSYQVKDDVGNDFGHSENRQGDVAKGRYYVLLPDGRMQIVEYVADQNGYQPQVKYEGTANAGGYPRGGAGGVGGTYGAPAQGGYSSGFAPSGGAGFGGNDGYRYKK